MADTAEPSTKTPFVGTSLFKKVECSFWILFIAIPIFTGCLAYDWLPDEAFDEERHDVVAGHWAGDGSHVRAEIWKNKRTGETFTIAHFAEHRKAEARRMASRDFAYGLIGCFFFAWMAALKKRGEGFAAFGKAVALNLAFAVIIWYTTYDL